jgi:hypothetical protein
MEAEKLVGSDKKPLDDMNFPVIGSFAPRERIQRHSAVMEEQVMESPFLSLVFFAFLVANIYLYNVFSRKISNRKGHLRAKKKREPILRTARSRDSA